MSSTFSKLLILLATAATVAATGTGWTALNDDATTGSLMVTVALSYNAAGLRRMKRQLLATSDPLSPRYGEPSWSLARVAAELAPSAAVARAVEGWLRGCGATLEDKGRHFGFVRASVGAGATSRCFGPGAALRRYRHAPSGAVTLAVSSSPDFSAAEVVPVQLAALVDFVGGLRLPSARAMASSRGGAIPTSHETQGQAAVGAPAFSLNPASLREVERLARSPAVNSVSNPCC